MQNNTMMDLALEKIPQTTTTPCSLELTYRICQLSVVFFFNKLANSIFSHNFSAKRTRTGMARNIPHMDFVGSYLLGKHIARNVQIM
jgi:hypothetical protein